MPKFQYSLIDVQGRKSWILEDAENLFELEELLNRRKIEYVEIKKASFLQTLSQDSSSESSARAQKVKSRELIEFCIHMGVLVEAGVPLTQAIKDFIAEVSNPYFKHIIKELYQGVTNGESFSDSLAAFPKVFTDEFVYLIRAGERTGTLPSALKELKKYLEWRDKIRSEMSQATVYPAIVATVVGIFILFLFSSVVPGIAKILIDLKVELPWMTKVVMWISNFILSYGIFLGVGLIIAIVTLVFSYRKYPQVAYEIDGLKLKIPVIGELTSLVLQARFIHNFSIIHRAGISILENLELCYKFVPNRIYQKAINQIREDVRDGESLSDSFRDVRVFSSLIVRMVAVGENSGNLDDSLVHASRYYDEEIPRKLKKVLSLLEPALILSLIGIVGFVALAIFLPIMSISGGLK